MAIDVLFSAVAGKADALADSTVDPAAGSQNSSAYLWHRVGEVVGDVQVPYLLNGNTLKGITDSKGRKLSSTDYSLDAKGILTLRKAYLESILSSTTKAGPVTSLTLAFTPGVSLTLQVIQFSKPTVPSTSSSYSLAALDANSDLHVPVAYQGLNKIAAIKAVKDDGTYLADDWTVYL